MRFEFTFGTSRPAARRRDGTPRRILVLSDLRGDSADAAAPLLDRPIVRVDVDNVEELLARHAPAVALGAQAGDARLHFRTFEDFHPDTLVRHAPLFGRLLDLRRRLQDPATFAGALAELRQEAAVTTPSERPVSPPVAADERSTFERLLGQQPGAAPHAQAAPAALSPADELIRRAIAPYVVPAADPRLPQLLSAVDTALTDVMRTVLHDARFQEVEAAWRGIQWLVSSLELGEDLELHLLHVTRAELPSGAGPASELYRRLVDREARTTSGLDPSVIVGSFRFGATLEDLALLESMSVLAQAIGAPFVAECGASLLGTSAIARQPDPRDWKTLPPEIEARWSALRHGPAAAFVGLALPRFLLRSPYGHASDPIGAFGFEEQPPRAEHESFLWGNPAFACAAVMARVLVADDVSSDVGDIANLPAFVVGAGDERRLQPCAEVCLSERAVQAITARGVMPLVSFGDQNAARLIRLQSIADPPTALVG